MLFPCADGMEMALGVDGPGGRRRSIEEVAKTFFFFFSRACVCVCLSGEKSKTRDVSASEKGKEVNAKHHHPMGRRPMNRQLRSLLFLDSPCYNLALFLLALSLFPNRRLLLIILESDWLVCISHSVQNEHFLILGDSSNCSGCPHFLFPVASNLNKREKTFSIQSGRNRANMALQVAMEKFDSGTCFIFVPSFFNFE